MKIRRNWYKDNSSNISCSIYIQVGEYQGLLYISCNIIDVKKGMCTNQHGHLSVPQRPCCTRNNCANLVSMDIFVPQRPCGITMT